MNGLLTLKHPSPTPLHRGEGLGTSRTFFTSTERSAPRQAGGDPHARRPGKPLPLGGEGLGRGLLYQHRLARISTMTKTTRDWLELATKDLKGRPIESLNTETPGGHHAEAALHRGRPARGVASDLPGFAPFTRGVRSTMLCRAALDHPPICRLLDGGGIQRILPQEPRRRAEGLSVAFDLATHRGRGGGEGEKSLRHGGYPYFNVYYY